MRQLGLDVALLGLLDPALDVANGVEVLGEPAVVGRAERLAADGPRPGRTESSMLRSLVHLREPLRGAVALPEQAAEHFPRIGLDRQRRRRRPPRQRVHVGAAVAVVAVAHEVDRLERQLQRGQRRVLRRISRAAIWSTVTPSWTSAPSVRFAWMPLSHAAVPRE